MDKEELTKELEELRSATAHSVLVSAFNPAGLVLVIQNTEKAFVKMINYLNENSGRPVEQENAIANSDPIQLSFLGKIKPERAEHLRDDPETINKYINLGNDQNVAVLSLDIRRSTSLMQNAIDSNKYSEFITKLFATLKDTVVDNDGIFDKFTGDGLLAYFTEKYSGSDYIDKLIKCSYLLIEKSIPLFSENLDLFSKKPEYYGIGIGCDVGLVKAVTINNDFTFIGEAVVNACRICGSSCNEIYVNNLVYHKVKTKEYVKEIKEHLVEYKHEGKIIVFGIEVDKSKIT